MSDERDASRDALRRAMALQAEDRIDEAIAEAELATRIDPVNAEAHSYLGQTLVTRKRDYAHGLAELQRARDLAPRDPWIRFTLGWCYELVAHDWPRGRPTPAGLPPIDELRQRAIEEFYACLDSDPEPGLADDVIKLLASLGEYVED